MRLLISTPRWQSWPMPACTPERGSARRLERPFCARTMLNGAVPGDDTAAPKPAVKLRRLSRAAFRLCFACHFQSPPVSLHGFAPMMPDLLRS